MSDYLIHLSVPPYLAQYYICKRGGTSPVKLKRGTPESQVLEYYLAPWPVGASPTPPPDCNLVIDIPWYKPKDPRTYNYLPPKAAILFCKKIRSLLCDELWNAMAFVNSQNREIQSGLYAFMERNGIEDTETNYLALNKIYQRMRQKHQRKNTKNRNDFKGVLS